jgi:hypothetical protein
MTILSLFETQEQPYTVERRPFGGSTYWEIIHTASSETIPGWREYPENSGWNYPPYEVSRFQDKAEAERVATEQIDWPEIDRVWLLPETQAEYVRVCRLRDWKTAWQQAYDRAKAGDELYPWDTGGFNERVHYPELSAGDPRATSGAQLCLSPLPSKPSSSSTRAITSQSGCSRTKNKPRRSATASMRQATKLPTSRGGTSSEHAPGSRRVHLRRARAGLRRHHDGPGLPLPRR